MAAIRGRPSDYTPNFPMHAQVRLLKKNHRCSGRTGTIIAILVNPSEHPERQWYDVKFGNGMFGRFLEGDLEVVNKE